MKKLFLILLLFGCSNSNKMVYWCGDHPCINNKEKKAYFKKTMTIEMRELSSVKKMSKSEIEKIKEQIKEQDTAEEKKQIENKKYETNVELAKEARLEEKRKIKEEKLRIKEEKKLAKKSKKIKKLETKKEENREKKIVIDTGAVTIDVSRGFQVLVEKITRRDKVKSYPDINNIPK